MSSPFSFFRKHQAKALAILFLLVIIAFTLGDSLQTVTQSGGNVPPILIFLSAIFVMTSILWVVGMGQGKSTEYAGFGALLGVLIAIIITNFLITKPTSAVTTSFGNFQQREIQDLIQRRQTANQFVQLAYAKVNPPPSIPDLSQNPQLAQMLQSNPQFQQMLLGPRIEWENKLRGFLFGFDSRFNLAQDVILGELFNQEADKLNIVVSNDSVEKFIKELTDQKLSNAEFNEILKELKLDSARLYDILRQQRRAQLAAKVLAPAAYPPPQDYWDLFTKVHTTAEIELAKFPVEEFKQLVPEPTESQLKAFFDEYKEKEPGQLGEPGFMQPRQVKLAYLQVPYADLEQELDDTVTDADVQKYYDDNKDTEFRIREIPDNDPAPSTPENPLNPSLPGPAFPPIVPEPRQPLEAPRPEAAAPAENQPAETKPAEEKPAEPKPEEKSPENNQSALPGLPGPTEPVLFQDDQPAPGKPGEEEKPAGENPPGQPPRYRELDDALKLQIRAKLLQQKIEAKMTELIHGDSGAIQEMFDWSNAYRNLERDEKTGELLPGDVQKVREEILAQMEAWAKDHPDVHYAVTPFLDFDALRTSEEHPIGGGFESSPDDGPSSLGTPVAQAVLEQAADQLFDPRSAVTFSKEGNRDWYAYWKVDDLEPHVPTFDEEGVAKKVKEAFILEEARKLAEKRAQEVADAYRKQGGELDQFLKEQKVTITGEKDSLQVSFQESGPFAWLQISGNLPNPSNPFQQQNPQLRYSDIANVSDPGDEFRKTVFEQLEPGESGVTHGQQRENYYLVKLVGKNPSGEAELAEIRQKFLQTQFAPSPFLAPLQATRFELEQAWIDKLLKEYDVNWDALASNEN